MRANRSVRLLFLESSELISKIMLFSTAFEQQPLLCKNLVVYKTGIHKITQAFMHSGCMQLLSLFAEVTLDAKSRLVHEPHSYLPKGQESPKVTLNTNELVQGWGTPRRGCGLRLCGALSAHEGSFQPLDAGGPSS